MYIVAIAWLYVALMMAVAEATNTTGTLLGAFFTFLLYGVGPVALVLYLLGTPARRRRLKAGEAAAAEVPGDTATAADAAPAAAGPPPVVAASLEPDAGGHSPADAAVAPVRKEP